MAVSIQQDTITPHLAHPAKSGVGVHLGSPDKAGHVVPSAQPECAVRRSFLEAHLLYGNGKSVL
jgi:hypothetical protein